MGGFPGATEVGLQVQARIQVGHLHPGHHDFSHGALRELEEVLDEFLFRQVQDALGPAAVEDVLQLFLGRRALAVGLGGSAQHPLHAAAEHLEKGGKRADDPGPEQQRSGGAEGPRDRAADGEAPGHQFGEHHLEQRDEEEAEGRAHEKARPGPRKAAQQALENLHEGILPHRAEGDGEERDRHLDAREVPGEVLMDFQRRAGRVSLSFSASSWVARTRTAANSASTKKAPQSRSAAQAKSKPRLMGGRPGES